MAKSQFSISLFFTLLCLWSATAAPDLTARVETLEETISAQNQTLQRLTRVLSLVQNELESRAGKNETDVLDKELKAIQQTFAELKSSGSKISSPRNNIPHTTTCGGSVTFKKEHEIRYQVPSPQNWNESEPEYCMWIVKNSEPLGLVLELTDVERQEDFQLWMIHSNLSRSGFYSTPENINELDTIYSTPFPYCILYFRLNPSTVNNNNNNNNETISFKLNIKRNIFSHVPKYSVKTLELTPNSSSNPNSTPSFQSFKYPLPPSTVYSANERTFIILKPTKSGNSLRLKMKSVHTEARADSVEVITFSGKPISKARLSGNMTTAREFRSGPNEPLLVFFRSDSSGQLSGFSFDYLEEKYEVEVPSTDVQSTCGGFVSVASEAEISYQVPTNQNSSVCIWIVKNVLAGPLQLELTEQDRWTNPESTELFIIHSISGNYSEKIPINMRDPSISFSAEVDPYFLLYFRFNPNPNLQDHNGNQNNSFIQQGFKLLLRDSAQGGATNLIISHTELSPSSTPTEKKVFSYPVGASQYQDNERAFIIIKPTARGSKIKIDMTSLDTEPNYDRVQIMSYSKQEEEMTLDSYFTGTFDPSSPTTFKGRENEPVIVYFISDGSNVRSGFTFTYSEVRTNARSWCLWCGVSD